MMSSSQLGKLDALLREYMETDQCFGGISIIFTGDLQQLKPCMGSPLYVRPPPGIPLALRGHQLWNTALNTVVILTENHRAAQDPEFRQVLNACRTGGLVDTTYDSQTRTH